MARKIFRILVLAGLIASALGTGSPSFGYNYAWSSYEDRTEPQFPQCENDPCCGNSQTPGCACDTAANPCSACLGSPGDPMGNGGLGDDHGSPVFLKLGLLEWSEIDIALRGVPSIKLRRNYYAKNPYDGLFGNSIVTNFEKFFGHVVKYSKDENKTLVKKHYYLLRLQNNKRYYFAFDPLKKSFKDLGKTGLRPEYVDDRKVLLHYPQGTTEEYEDGYLTKIVYPDGKQIVLRYDENMLLQQVSSESGRSLRFFYNTNGKVAEIQDDAQRVWEYEYDENGNLVTVKMPGGEERHYTYQRYKPANDAQVYYLLSSITDAEGKKYLEVTYDTLGRVASYAIQGHTWRYSYHSTTEVEKSDGVQDITYTLNERGIIVGISDAAGNSYSRRVEGNVTIDTDPLGGSVRREYDSLRRLVAYTDELGNTTRYYYEGNNPHPVKIVSPMGRITTIRYNSAYQPVNIIDPLGNSREFQYDTRGNLVAITDAKGNKTTIDYNENNLPVSITDALGNTKRFKYDERGNLIAFTDEEGHTTYYSYDAADRLIKTTDALGSEIKYSYDKAGRLVGVIDPAGNKTSYEYDDYGRLAKEIRPDGRVYSYSYNEQGRLASVIRPEGTEVKYSYDPDGRITSIQSGDEKEEYRYDALGRLVHAQNGTSTVEFAYDAAGRLIKETQDGTDVNTAYDKDSEVIRLSFLDQSIAYTRNALGLATKIGGVSLHYDSNAILTQIGYPDGTSEAYTFDAVYNVTKIQTANEILNYTHDKTGRITSKNATDYSYDAIGRLTQAGPESFSYDIAGNILNNNASYDTKNNRLLTSDLYSLTYDALGNIKSKYNKLTKETTTYTFDTRNRLVKYVKTDENNQTIKTLEFAYDALGRRVSKTEDGITQHYLYDGDNVIAILDDQNNVIATITHDESIDTPLSITNANGTFYYHRDHQGSIIALTDESGNVVESFTYDNHYGAIINHSKTIETNNPYGYTGRVVDTKDLYYYRARYYDPTIQRFISEDPIGFASGDFNFYRYVGDDPVNFKDPNGTCGGLCIGAAIIGGSYIIYTIYNAWFNFLKKVDEAKKAADKCAADPLNVNNWRDYNQKYLEAWKAGGGAALSVPGTSATGPVPTSAQDLIIGGASTYITNQAGLGN